MAEIFHILNRGVDKRTIFLDDRDRLRFIHDLYEFNDSDNVLNLFHYFKKNSDIGCRYIPKKRNLLVEIFSFCLMPNHYHILLSPKVENGVSLFMKKINMGYAKYFNERYERSGALFQGKYKSVRIATESHFIHMPYYIHLNPLDLFDYRWRERKLKNKNKAIDYLKSYRWSSHLDYLGKKNFPSVISKNFLTDYFEGEKNYQKEIYSWLDNLELENFSGFLLE